LIDILVFGRRAGRDMAHYIREHDFASLPPDPDRQARERVEALLKSTGSERAGAIRAELQAVMMDNVGVFRVESQIRAALAKIGELKERYQQVAVDDKGKRFNSDLLEAIELGGLLDLAEVTAAGALVRTESRGAHSREDYPLRDDANWLKHTLAYQTEKGIEFRYKPVAVTRFEPKPRTY